MKAIKIDAENRKVEEIEINNLIDMQKAVGGFIQVGYGFPDTPDVIFVDEEGLLKEPKNFFALDGQTEILAGNGLILGTGKLGESIDAVTPLEYIKSKVLWMDDLAVACYMAFMQIAEF